MSGTDGPEVTRRVGSLLSPDRFVEAKMHPPPTHKAWVERGRLLDKLDGAIQQHIVVLVAAPAGFGKTTLVAQWLASSRTAPAAVAWISLDVGDNDPGRLWSHAAVALERVGCELGPDMATFLAANSGEVIAGVLPRLINAMAARAGGVTLVLDDFHFVHAPACHEQVEFLIEHMPPQASLVITSRADPGLRLGRLRAAGRLTEIRADDLAFDADELLSLLTFQNVRLSSRSVRRLMDRTEGWPAGLYLATLSLSGRPDSDEFVRRFSGNNRFIGDYLTEEVLSRLPDRVREFILTISILDRFTPALCDFVAETSGSAGMLHDLERSNMLLVPLDETGQWFRFHHLFTAVVRSELEVKHPERIPSLHARAAVWFRDHGDVEEAVVHLLSSGELSGAAVLIQANWLTFVDAGRAATVFGWLAALGPISVAANPAAGVTAAWMAALSGDEAGVAEHLQTLQEFRSYGPLPDGTRCVESAIAMIQGLFGYGGPIEMAAGARRAVELETDGRSPFYVMASLTRGHSAYVAGNLELAINLLAKVSDHEAAPAVIRIMILSVQSLAEAERGRHDRSGLLAERAMEVVEHGSLHRVPQASMAFTAFGLAQMTAGKVRDAMATVEHGLVLRRRNPALGPWATLHHLLVAARVAVNAGELPMAQQLLEDASERIDRFPDGMASMRVRLDAVGEELRSRLEPATDVEALTGRELDVLKLLLGSMSLPQIADELYVSTNTVKTHTQALYRKLGARSRSEATQIARRRLLV